MKLTQTRLTQLILYDKETGLITRRVTTRNAKASTTAGSVRNDGYVQLSVDGKMYLAHRLIWLFEHGYFPTGDIDHINGVRSDNRLSNLRSVLRGQNMQNICKALRESSTGYLGVFPNKNRFSASLRVNKVRHHLGTFDTPAEAHEAYKNAKRLLHPFSSRL